MHRLHAVEEPGISGRKGVYASTAAVERCTRSGNFETPATVVNGVAGVAFSIAPDASAFNRDADKK